MRKMRKMRKRAPNLTDADLEAIVGILDGWTSRLTWDGLIAEIKVRRRAEYTRQALHQHERIRLAYSSAKKRLDGKKPDTETPKPIAAAEGVMLLQRNARLEAEVARLKLENARLLEQFHVWAYNAFQRGLDIEYLNTPLPHVDRDTTKVRLPKERSR